MNFSAFSKSCSFGLPLLIPSLVRAVSKPYPGAFSEYDGKAKIIFWKADSINNNKYYIGILSSDEAENYYSIKFKKNTKFKLEKIGA